MAESHGAHAGLGEPDAEVVDGRVRRRRAQHALATLDPLAHDLDERAGLARTWRAPDQRDVAAANAGVDCSALLLVELVVDWRPGHRREQLRGTCKRRDFT